MESTQSMHRIIATAGWSALFVWWGLSLLIGPITIGMSAVGTGLILLGVNGAYTLKRIPPNPSNTFIGLIALVWGALDHVLALPFGPSFATLLIVCGVVIFGTLLARPAARRMTES